MGNVLICVVRVPLKPLTLCSVSWLVEAQVDTSAGVQLGTCSVFVLKMNME